MVSAKKNFKVFPIISLWKLLIPWAGPDWTQEHGWQDLRRGPLDITTY